MAKVLVVATSRKTRGGIASVVKNHESGAQWQTYHCKWIETHIDTSSFAKVLYFVRAMVQYLFLLPAYDIVHIHLAAPTRKIPFIFLARVLHKKIILHLHFPDPATSIWNKKRSKRYKWCLERADIVITLSKGWKKMIEDTFHLNNVTVLYNACPAVNRKDTTDKEPYILFSGTLTHRKGFDDLLIAFSKIHDKCPDWRLVFAGNGEIEQAKQLAIERGIEKKCIFLGWVSGDGKDAAFRKASAFCLPSYAEGFPMSVLDAWAYGLPVITTPVGGLPDVLENQVNALVFEPGNTDQLAECLLSITDDSLRKRLSASSIHLSESIFNSVEINRQLGQIYNSLEES